MLSDKPVRKDLTDRECGKLLGAVIGGLVQMAEAADVYSAVRHCADAPEAWKAGGGSFVMSLAEAAVMRGSPPGLSERPARQDLTDMECVHLLNAFIVGLVGVSDVGAVYRGVRWWADTPEAWKLFGFEPN